MLLINQKNVKSGTRFLVQWEISERYEREDKQIKTTQAGIRIEESHKMDGNSRMHR